MILLYDEYEEEKNQELAMIGGALANLSIIPHLLDSLSTYLWLSQFYMKGVSALSVEADKYD